MQKVSGSRPDGVQDKKEKKKTVQEAWIIRREKEGGKWGTEAGNRRKEARDVARESA